MNRRTAFLSVTLLTLVACAFPQSSFAQGSPLIGTWKVNLAKSNYTGGAPRSQTNTYQQDGQNIRGSNQVIDAQGNAASATWWACAVELDEAPWQFRQLFGIDVLSPIVSRVALVASAPVAP